MRVNGGWKLMAAAAGVLAALFIVSALSPSTTAGPCTVIGETAMLDDVPEASGLALSRRHAGVIWTHNDSGHDTVLYAVDATGRALGRVRVPARTRDWEDLSAGACPAGDCLYLADVGDNDLARRAVQVLRVPEPDPGASRTAPPDVFTLTYPDGPHNAEALFIVESTVFVVTKDRDGMLYRSTTPLGDARELRLRRMGALGLTGVTGAEASTDGQSVVVRTSREAVVYRTAEIAGGPDPSTSSGSPRATSRGDKARPTIVPIGALREPQGEGVALDGDVLYLASERGAWNSAGRLLSLRCSLP